MQSKTSYFSKTIFFKNITHYWPIWSEYLLICLFRLPFSLYTSLKAQVTDVMDPEAFRISQLQETVHTALQPFPLFLFACMTAIAVFSYLYQARSANVIHSLPVCRESLFITNVLSGLCFLLIPQMIAFLAGVFVCFIQHMTQLEYLMHWLILSTGMAVFAFALAAAVVMITGNIIAAPIFYLIVNYLFVACRDIVAWFVEDLSFGISDAGFTFGDFLSPYYFWNSYFTGSFSLLFGTAYREISMPELYPYIGGYFAASMLLFLLAFIIYRKKHLETTGDIVALPFLRPLFRWGFAFCTGSCIALFGYSFFTPEKRAGNNLLPILILMAVGSAIAFFLAEMLLQKKFVVFCKRKCLECGILVSLALIFVACVDFDLFGTETKLPRQEEIASIYLHGSYPIDVDEEDFPQVLAIHQSLIASKEETEQYFQKYSENCNFTNLVLSYTLKNGKSLSRDYYIPIEDYYLEQPDYSFNQIAALSHDPEYYMRYHFTDTYKAVTFTDASFEVYTGNEFLDYVTLDQAQCNEVYEAFKQDVYEGNYCIYDSVLYEKTDDKVYYNGFYLNYYAPQGSSYISYGGMDMIQDANMLHGTSINLTTSCVHTLEALERLGIVNENQRMITQKEADVLFRVDEY